MTSGSRSLPLLLAGFFLLLLGAVLVSTDAQAYLPRLVLVSGALLLMVFVIRHAGEIRFLLLQVHRYAEPGPTLTLLLLALVCGLGGLVMGRWVVPIDLTYEKVNSLSERTRAALEAAGGPLRLDGFYVEGSAEWEQARRLLDIYERSAPRLTATLSDPDRAPERARAAGITRSGLIVASLGKARTEIDQLSEKTITQGILRILEGRPRRIAFLQGHGEPSLGTGGESGITAWVADLRSANILAEELPLLGRDDQLEGVDALLIVHPQQPLYASETAAVRAYLERGGRVGLWLEPADSSGLEDYLAFHSLKVLPGVIRDRGRGARALGLGPWAVPLGLSQSHAVTANLNVRPVALQARPLQIISPHPMELIIERLLVTAKLQSDPETVLEVVADVGAGADSVLQHGRQLVGAALEWDVPVGEGWSAAGDSLGLPPVKPKARVLVFGDASWVTNRYLGVGGNRSLARGAVQWLTFQDRLLGALRAPIAPAQLRVNHDQLRMLLYAVEFGLPLLLMLWGLIVWLRRRGGGAAG